MFYNSCGSHIKYPYNECVIFQLLNIDWNQEEEEPMYLLLRSQCRVPKLLVTKVGSSNAVRFFLLAEYVKETDQAKVNTPTVNSSGALHPGSNTCDRSWNVLSIHR
ncbi:MAG: hypothetical protein V3U06_03585 [Candidatus Binatia bacterium]